MIVPPPRPAYTLAPGIESLSEDHERLLGGVLTYLTGRLGGLVVSRATHTETHVVLELETAVGSILIVERHGEEGAAA